MPFWISFLTNSVGSGWMCLPSTDDFKCFCLPWRPQQTSNHWSCWSTVSTLQVRAMWTLNLWKVCRVPWTGVKEYFCGCRAKPMPVCSVRAHDSLIWTKTPWSNSQLTTLVHSKPQKRWAILIKKLSHFWKPIFSSCCKKYQHPTWWCGCCNGLF